jgi:hypothetical protein
MSKVFASFCLQPHCVKPGKTFPKEILGRRHCVSNSDLFLTTYGTLERLLNIGEEQKTILDSLRAMLGRLDRWKLRPWLIFVSRHQLTGSDKSAIGQADIQIDLGFRRQIEIA